VWRHDVGVSSCAFSPEANRVAAGDQAGGLHLLALVGVAPRPMPVTTPVFASPEHAPARTSDPAPTRTRKRFWFF
jgi:hypothetical protein